MSNNWATPSPKLVSAARDFLIQADFDCSKAMRLARAASKNESALTRAAVKTGWECALEAAAQEQCDNLMREVGSC